MTVPQISIFKVQRLFRRHGAEFVRHLQREYGARVRANIPLLPPNYYLFEPNDIHQVLVTQVDHFEKPALIRRILQFAFGEGLFTSSGDLWKRQRRLMQPTFHHARVSHFAEGITQQTTSFLTAWQGGETRLIDEEMHDLTFRVVIAALFSGDVSGDAQAVAQAMKDLRDTFTQQGSTLVKLLLPSWMFGNQQRSIQTFNRLVHQMIAERRSLGEKASPSDLLSALVFNRDETTGMGMPDHQLRDELVTLYIAGHETTAVLLGWVWVLLAQHPKIESKLHHELDTVLGSRVPQAGDLANLPYVMQVIKETLRLFPPVWYLFREALTNVTIGGEVIPRGSIVFLFPYVTHRDARWFDQAEAFMPERWHGDFEKSLPKGVYLPFGSGPRVCIGNGFALLEAQLMLATIAQRFRIELLTEPHAHIGVTTLGFDQPVRIKLHGR